MHRLTNYAIILVLSLSCAEFCSIAASQASPQNKTSKKATGSVSGRISVKGKGKAGITVGVRAGDFGSQPKGPLSKAITDEEGKYRITDLPGGSYQVAPVAPALVMSDFNSFGQQGKVVLLAEGENVEDIDFSMVRGGVITGKVTHADGRPVMEERISVVVVEHNNRQGQGSPPQSGSGSYTDDRGIYRVFGLLAGKYKISVGHGSDTFAMGTGRSTYELVFHSDPSNPNEAKVIELGEGAEATNIDITIGQSISGFAATGVVIDGETNKPLANLRFGLQKRAGDRGSFTGSSVQSDRLGAFRFENLTPGKYSVVNMPQPNSDLRGDSITFDVVDQDVSGLIVRASRGASVSGTVVLEGTPDKTVQSKLVQLRLHAYNLNETGGSGFVESASINHDGSFRIVGLQPGVIQFQLSAQDRGLLTGYVISRVELEGVVLPRGVEIKSGEQIFGLRIVVSYGSGSVRGTVKLENGPLPADARLMVRLMKQEDPSGSLGHPNIDARGRFAIEGVPAGSYELHVNAFIPGSRARAPSFRQLVTVTEGSVTEVEVVLVLVANPSHHP